MRGNGRRKKPKIVESEKSDDGNEHFSLPTQTHTTFKCIGSTYDADAQECLSKASQILHNNGIVEMMMAPEPRISCMDV